MREVMYNQADMRMELDNIAGQSQPLTSKNTSIIEEMEKILPNKTIESFLKFDRDLALVQGFSNQLVLFTMFYMPCLRVSIIFI